MRKGIAGLLAVCCWIFAGCSGKDSVPFGILPVDKMSPILWDIIEADQYAAILVKDSTHVDPKLERLRLYAQVFRTHGITREKFQKSYNYYKEHPEINKTLYDSLAAQGDRYRNEAYAHPAARPAVTPAAPASVTPVSPPTATPPAATHMSRPSNGRFGIPIIKPNLRPDTSHHKTHMPALHSGPGHSSSTPPARTPV
jgi:hypothetical protein